MFPNSFVQKAKLLVRGVLVALMLPIVFNARQELTTGHCVYFFMILHLYSVANAKCDIHLEHKRTAFADYFAHQVNVSNQNRTHMKHNEITRVKSTAKLLYPGTESSYSGVLIRPLYKEGVLFFHTTCWGHPEAQKHWNWIRIQISIHDPYA